MNTTSPHPAAAETSAFVERVRTHLSDLGDQERDELTGDLEADLADQLADGARVDLGDPRAYAAELRRAAGLPDPSRRPRAGHPQVVGVESALDMLRAGFLGAVTSRRWSAATWDVAREVRPVWWVARAWIAVSLLDAALGHHTSLVPSFSHPVVAFTALAVALVLSVLLGLGRLQPGRGTPGHLTGRVVVLAVNVVLLAGTTALSIPMPGYLVGSGTCI